LGLLSETAAETIQVTNKLAPKRLARARLKPGPDGLLAADKEENRSGAPLPNANKVTP
jgi:hypothetical protein